MLTVIQKVLQVPFFLPSEADKPDRLKGTLSPPTQGEIILMARASLANSASPLASYAMPNEWFKAIGLFPIDEVKTGVLASYY